MAYGNSKSKNGWALFLLILAGIVIGGFIGTLIEDIPFLKWLNYGASFGMGNKPLNIDLSVFNLMFLVNFNITITSIIGIVIAIFIYRKI